MVMVSLSIQELQQSFIDLVQWVEDKSTENAGKTEVMVF